MKIKKIERLSSRVKTEKVLGIEIPYLPSEQITHRTAGGEEVRDVVPLYITHLRAYEKTQGFHHLVNAFTSAAKEIQLHMNRGMSLKIKGIEAPIAVSAEQPVNTVCFDGERIILNEAQAEKWKIDADGDRGLLVIRGNKAILLKFPITQYLLILTKVDRAPKEKFFDIEPVVVEPTEFEERELFKKAHQDAPVGLLTSIWGVENAQRAMNHGDFLDALTEFCKDPQQCIDIEDNCMKAVRKDQVQANFAGALEKSNVTFDHKHVWALTGANSITGKTNPKSWNWVWNTDLTQNAEDILNLKFKFRTIKPPETRPKHQVQLDPNLLYRLLPAQIMVNGNPVDNPVAISKHGFLQFIELPIEGMPPAIILMMTNAQGQICGLTDIKRLEKNEDGLTFAHYLPPVFDNLELVTPNNELVPASKKFVHPLLHMAKVLSTTDSIIRNPITMEPTKMFPSSVQDFSNPKYSVKLSILQKAVTEYCGRYGLRAGASKENGRLMFSQYATSITKSCVLIDYGRDMSEEEMWQVAKLADSQRRLNLAGNKGTNRRIRKYALANPDGTAEWAPEGCHPARPGKQISQLSMAASSVNMRVAVVSMTTETGVLITPSGIDKQMVETVFLPEVVPTREEWERRLKSEDLDPNDPLNQPKIVLYDTWSGEKRVAFISDPKTSITIGKLVDPLGNKFMPRRYPQGYLNYDLESITSLEHQLNELNERTAKHHMGTKKLSKARLEFLQKRAVEINDKINQVPKEPIDLIIPITELQAKGCTKAFLKNAKEQIVVIDGRRIKAFVVDRKFYRTGCASENVPPRHRSGKYKGIDAFPIQNALYQAFEKYPERTINFAFPEALKKAFLQVASKENFDPTQTLVEEEYDWDGEQDYS